MSENGFADFLHGTDGITASLSNRVYLLISNVSEHLKTLRSSPAIDFDRQHTVSPDAKPISLSELARQHEELDTALTYVIRDKKPRDVDDDVARGLFVDFHKHASDLTAVLGGLSKVGHDNLLRDARSAAESLELAAMALIGLSDAYHAGRQSIAQNKPAHPVRPKSGQQR